MIKMGSIVIDGINQVSVVNKGDIIDILVLVSLGF